MTKPRKKRRSATLRQSIENIQYIAQRKSDRVTKAILVTVRCKPMPDLPAPRKKSRSGNTNNGSDPDRYVGYSAVGQQKMRGSSTIPRGVY
ncbi:MULTISPECIES: hypothetical protein [unclassified Brenneria]|uniref:hypothetical protein n=1 Tax=unclassified Brenneria TaxID=2634434 RepID=UPI00155337DD|nr:hypothetical protein [Brenneria sp. hezel4-2-4]MEE3649494.1 hypothetical protein [Brenneria sp. HEZEL_4_2_4]NPC99451.1 hypothetical protein [Brenneria sp. hezel4-2-4]